MAHQSFACDPVDPDLEPGKAVIGQMGEKGAHSVVPTVSSIHAKSQISQGKRDVIEDHQNFLGPPAEESCQRANGPPAFVHIGHGLDQEDLPGPAGLGFPFRFEAERSPGPFRQEVEHPESHVMTGLAVFFARIPQADDTF